MKIKLKIITRLDSEGRERVHIVNPGDSRADWTYFCYSILPKLKEEYRHEIRFDLYSNQPVYEYKTTKEDLTLLFKDNFPNIEVEK